jgi:phosphohistidine phosphatase SixA
MQLTLQGVADSELVKSRMRGLSLFVDALAASPFLMSDATLEKYDDTQTDTPPPTPAYYCTSSCLKKKKRSHAETPG